MSLSIGALFAESWRLFIARWRFFVPLMIVLGLASILLNGAIGMLEQAGHTVFATIINAVAALFGFAVGLGLANIFLITTAGGTPAWRDFVSRLSDWSLIVRYAVGSLLFGLMVMVGFFLLVILINIVGVIPLGLGLLITAPLSKIATVLAYRKLEVNPGPEAARLPAASL